VTLPILTGIVWRRAELIMAQGYSRFCECAPGAGRLA
jgi:hypothetical protein